MAEEWRASALEGGPSDERVQVPGKPEALAGSDAVRYETRFDDPREAADDVAVIELRGLYAHSEVTVSGERLDGEGAVEHHAYFEPLRIPFEPDGETELAVVCHRPRDRFGGLYDSELVSPAERVPGIWWDVCIEGRRLPYVEHVAVRPELDGDVARLHLRTTVVAGEALSDRLTYAIRPEGTTRRSGMMERASVETAGPGRTTVEDTVELREPARWWPRELGEQSRYTVRAKLGDSERAVTTGVCEVERDGGAVRVNGERLSVRGVNVLGGEPADIERARELNATVIRAHANVLPEECYERCDAEGLLVWQDLPLTGPGAFDRERARELTERMGRLRRHPSVAVYTVHDDPVEPFGDRLGDGLFDRLRFRWRAWRAEHDPSAAEAVADALPEDRPVVPIVAPPGVAGEAGSYYPGWKYGSPESIDDLLERYPVDVVAEFGAPAADSEAAVAQAALCRTVAERLRLAGVGALAFALRDASERGMGVFASGGTPKPAAAELERAFRPIQALLADPTPGRSDVVIVNELPTGFSVTLAWTAGEETGELEATVDGGERWRGGPIPVPSRDPVELELRVGEHVVETSYKC